MGYRKQPRVEAPGDAAIHGKVVDVFSGGALTPVRIELSEEALPTLYRFDPSTQRTTDSLDRFTLDAATDLILLKGPASQLNREPQPFARIFDYVPDALLIVDEGCLSSVEAKLRQIDEARSAMATLAVVRAARVDFRDLPDRLYLSRGEWRNALLKATAVSITEQTKKDYTVPVFARRSSLNKALSDFVAERIAAGCRVVFAAESADDARSIVRRLGKIASAITPASCWSVVRQAPPGSMLTIRLDLDEGFALSSDRIVVIAAADVLGSRAKRAGPFFRAAPNFGAEDDTPKIGDAVVHSERGLGLLSGLERVALPEAGDREMVRLQFADNASLIVPPSELAAIWRYGAANKPLVLNDADGSSWRKRRTRLRREIGQTARRLVELARARLEAQAPEIIPPTAQFERFSARFSYELTPDQQSAAEAVAHDLASGRPMDRVICGDVGYGKTEVALRAAATCLLSGRQTLLIAPTTVLARQHLETCRRRFAGFDLEIGFLSRFESAGEARRVKDGAASGAISLLVGTHALLGPGVAYKKLGLVIIDEEQRFGVRQKAKLRTASSNVHVLTLTATPIPRSLQRALVGLQDVSVIATPPQRRLPVRTFSITAVSQTVRAALDYERGRGGQSFFVCPRIDQIAPLEKRLRDLDATLGLEVLHGKMPQNAIDSALIRFSGGKADILLSTNIVENGLDLPLANTMFIWHPEQFGIAQLHQLRGRVGRGARQAFVYLVTDPETTPESGDALERLNAVKEHSGLGAGFEIGQLDLDIRGAGDLFGAEQAGHLKLVGRSLYRHLLERAIAAARGERLDADFVPDIRLGLNDSLPPEYAPEERVRLELYSRIWRSPTEELAGEIEDRLGPMPEAVLDLLEIAKISSKCRSLGIKSLEAGPNAIALRLRRGSKIHRLAGLARAGLLKSGERWISKIETSGRRRLAVVASLLDSFDATAKGPEARLS